MRIYVVVCSLGPYRLTVIKTKTRRGIDLVGRSPTVPDGRSGFKPMSGFVLLNYVTR